MQLTRRGLLAGAAVGGGLLVAWGLWPRDYGVPLTPGPGEWAFGAWLKLGRDGVLTVAVPVLLIPLGLDLALAIAGAVTFGAAILILGRWPAPRAGNDAVEPEPEPAQT